MSRAYQPSRAETRLGWMPPKASASSSKSHQKPRPAGNAMMSDVKHKERPTKYAQNTRLLAQQLVRVAEVEHQMRAMPAC